jgi:hypothetical protein
MDSRGTALIAFVAGAGIGSVVTWWFTKDHYLAKADEEIEQVKEAYAEKLDEYREKHDIHEAAKGYEGSDVDGKEVLVTKKESRRERLKRLRDKPPVTEYYKMYKGISPKDTIEANDEEIEEEFTEEVGEVDPADLQHPQDDGEEYNNMDEELLRIDQEERNKAAEEGYSVPYIIDEADFNNGRPDFEKIDLDYWDDGIVTTFEEEELEDYPDLIGGCLNEKVNGVSFVDNDAMESLYVRNEALGVDYCVTKQGYAWGSEEDEPVD